MAEPADFNVDDLRRRARRRLVGAVVLALGVAVVVPMLLETEQKPLGEDVAVKIPPIDDGKFVNRLSENRAGASGAAKADAAKDAGSTPMPSSGTATPPKYDTRLPDAAPAARPAVVSPGAGSSDTAPTTTPSDKAAPAPARATDEVAKAAPGAASRPVEIKALPAPAEPPATSASQHAAAPPHDGFAVQLAAFADDKGANALAGRLKKSGYAAYTEPLKTSKGTLWRVRVGPYPSREAALTARDKLKTEGQSGIVAAIK